MLGIDLPPIILLSYLNYIVIASLLYCCHIVINFYKNNDITAAIYFTTLLATVLFVQLHVG